MPKVKLDIRDVYSGQFTNWSMLGGNDKSIFLSQLEKDIGGSEEIFSRVVSDISVKRNSEFVAYDMKNIIDLASWNDGGIGYAFNQFYSRMYNKENLKLVSVDGVYPSLENISSGKYPIMCNVYFTYRKNNSNKNILKVLNWIKSEEGRNLIIKCGLQPIDN
jgi:phosphate transport system substrate-binding protein